MGEVQVLTGRGAAGGRPDGLASRPKTKQPLRTKARRYSRRFAAKFITDNRAAAIATLGSDNEPHVAIVQCLVGKDLSIYFSTAAHGQKFANLTSQPHIAMAFQNAAELEMIQMSGLAEKVENPRSALRILDQLLKLRYEDPDWPAPRGTLRHKLVSKQMAIVKVTPSRMTFASFKTAHIGHYQSVFKRII